MTKFKNTKAVGSGINPENLQEVLEGSKNAGAKGQAAFYTPVELAEIIQLPLPDARRTIVDLTAGNGQLLVGCINEKTDHILALDIEACKTIPHTKKHCSTSRIAGDVCKLFPIFNEVDWAADLFVLNPPWDVHFYREPIQQLAESDTITISEAWHARDPRLGKDTIDSTVATLMMALHLCTFRGEGVLVCNNATLTRLIIGPDAPFRALKAHFWAHIVVKGNPMTGLDVDAWNKETTFSTAIVYFAKAHSDGIQEFKKVNTPDELKEACADLKKNRMRLRGGPEAGVIGQCQRETVPIWEAVKEEWYIRSGERKNTKYNIWLDKNGNIETYLSIFDEKSPKINRREADSLYKLNGENPMQLVVQQEQRQMLLHAVNSGIWRVHPDLPKQVDEAVRAYHAVRAPLYPLTPIQSMGYLDEENRIICKADLKVDKKVIFAKGKTYDLRTQTVKVERKTSKPMLNGEDHEMLLNGQELAIYIKDEDEIEHCFMDQRHKAEGVRIEADTSVNVHNTYTYNTKSDIKIDFILQDVEAHFNIPVVPDVALCYPDRYKTFIDHLSEIETLLNGKKLKNFQRNDLARSALHDGLIMAWDTGLGKTWATFLWPLIKVGRKKGTMQPVEPVLIVAPEHLHAQIHDEAMECFGIEITELDSQDTFFALSDNGILRPAFYISSFTQIATNKIQELLNPFEMGTDSESIAKMLHQYDLTIAQVKEEKNVFHEKDKTPITSVREKAKRMCELLYLSYRGGIGQERNGIKCVFSPSLADLVKYAFKCVVIDEATKIKGEETLIGVGVRSLCPDYRLVLTATPIKNRLPDIFWLAWWACGGEKLAHARFPYNNDEGEQEKFAGEFMVCQRDLTKEKAEAIAKGNKHFNYRQSKRRGSVTAEVCNIHRLWKLLAPIVLRRRKRDIGEEIVLKTRQPIRVPMGKQQAEVYKYHLTAPYKDKTGKPAMGAKLQALRSAAAAPHSALLEQVQHCDAFGKLISVHEGLFRSEIDCVPKVAAALNVIAEVLNRGEQVVVFSAFQEPLDTMARKLDEAGIPYDLLDGRKSAAKRGQLAAQFKKGLPSGKPVLLAGLKAMAEGHSWHLCNNGILLAFDWAYDLFEQAINRIHRLNSRKPVNIYPIICTGTIDRKLEALIEEKGNAAELVLDGKLMSETVEEVNLAELLNIAIREFDPKAALDEAIVQAEWPKLKEKLRAAYCRLSTGVTTELPTETVIVNEVPEKQIVLLNPVISKAAEKVVKQPSLFRFK